MSAALKSHEEAGAAVPVAAKTQRQLRAVSTPVRPVTMAFFPKTRQNHPLWLKLLITGQRLSFVAAAITTGGALSAYALTVDANRQLTLATASLGRLQDHQQQLTTANAVFKSHLAQTAMTAMENGTLHPRDVIFLEATTPTEASAGTPTAAPTNVVPDHRFFPKGY